MPFTIPNTADAAFAAQAQPFSTDIDILQQGVAGDGVLTGCAVTAQGSPDMTLAVAAGFICIAGQFVAVTAGNVTITTANATHPRIDLVVVNSSGTKSVTAGTAAAAPVAPAIPATSVVLAFVYVPATDTAIGSTQITDKRCDISQMGGLAGTFAQFGPLTDAAGIAACKGMFFCVTDVLGGGVIYRSDGTAWVQVTGGVDAVSSSVINAKGDLFVGTANDAYTRFSAGGPGEMLLPDTTASTGLDWITNPTVASVRPGAIGSPVSYETCGRFAGSASATVAAGTTGQLRMVAIWLPIDFPVESITFVIGSTGISGASHGWYALFDHARALLRQSTNDTTPAATAATAETYTLSSPFTTTYTGVHYIGCMWVATTMPTLTGFAGSGTLNGLVPIASGTSTGSLTTTAPNPAAAITAVGGVPYAYVTRT